MNSTAQVILDVIAISFMIFGLFFMVVAAIGLVRLPDLYHRMHASTKGVTLGIAGIMIATACATAQVPGVNTVRIITTLILVILFQFIANPVGAHLLAKAAHLDDCPIWKGNLSDELEEDHPTHQHGD
jgi:multicomponent Na+:H+ antiporter subunit G